MTFLLIYLAICTVIMAQEVPFMGPRWMLSDPILNLYERDKQYMLRQGSDKVHKMQVRQFFGDDDPFSEVFRIMNMIAEESERMINQSLLRINDLSNFQKRMNMTCEPSMVEGKWYQMRGIRCVSNSAILSPLQELITAAPEAEVESLQETTPGNTLQVPLTHSVSDSVPEGVLMSVGTKSHFTSIPLGTIVLCVLVLCLFGAIIVYVLQAVKQRRLDGRSITSHAVSVPNYGTICGVCYDTRFFFDWLNPNRGG